MNNTNRFSNTNSNTNSNSNNNTNNNTNNNNNTNTLFDEAFDLAVEHNAAELEKMLETDPSLVTEKQDETESTLLHAVLNNCKDTDNILSIVNSLVDKGADVNGQDVHGWTPLMMTFYRKCPGLLLELIPILNKYGKLDMNVKDKWYQAKDFTILHHILRNWEGLVDKYLNKEKSLTLLKLVLDLGANPYAPGIFNKKRNGSANYNEYAQDALNMYTEYIKRTRNTYGLTEEEYNTMFEELGLKEVRSLLVEAKRKTLRKKATTRRKQAIQAFHFGPMGEGYNGRGGKRNKTLKRKRNGTKGC